MQGKAPHAPTETVALGLALLHARQTDIFEDGLIGAMSTSPQNLKVSVTGLGDLLPVRVEITWHPAVFADCHSRSRALPRLPSSARERPALRRAPVMVKVVTGKRVVRKRRYLGLP